VPAFGDEDVSKDKLSRSEIRPPPVEVEFVVEAVFEERVRLSSMERFWDARDADGGGRGRLSSASLRGVGKGGRKG
jgi:hypothetical protein